MRNSIFAMLAAVALVGCGDDGGGKMDAGRDMGGGDMAQSVQPDMANPNIKHGCAYFTYCVAAKPQGLGLSDQVCLSRLSSDAVTKLQASLGCWGQQCGTTMGAVDGGMPKPCDVDPAGMGCQTCRQNTLKAPANPMMPGINYGIDACDPTNAPECEQCWDEFVTCDGHCVVDEDCKALKDQNNNSPPCVNGSCLGG